MWSYEHLYLTCFCLFQSHNLASIFVPTKAKSLIISMVYFRGSNETERIVLSLHSGWEEHRQASLQVKAETQVLKETERKWEEGLVSVFQLMEARNRLLVAKAEKIRVRLQYELTSRLTMYYRTGSFINH